MNPQNFAIVRNTLDLTRTEVASHIGLSTRICQDDIVPEL